MSLILGHIVGNNSIEVTLNASRAEALCLERLGTGLGMVDSDTIHSYDVTALGQAMGEAIGSGLAWMRLRRTDSGADWVWPDAQVLNYSRWANANESGMIVHVRNARVHLVCVDISEWPLCGASNATGGDVWLSVACADDEVVGSLLSERPHDKLKSLPLGDHSAAKQLHRRR